MKPYNEEILVRTGEYIEKFQRERGQSPSLREIMNAFESFFGSSVSKVQRYVLELSRRGRIEYERNVGIIISDKFFTGKMKAVPLVGECACGEPILAVENIVATYSLPVELFGSSEHYLLRARGNSMIEKGINDGDIMVVRNQDWANLGDVIIARVNDDEATTKIYTKKDDRYILRAANNKKREDGTPEYPDIFPEGEWEILGVVDTIIRRIR